MLYKQAFFCIIFKTDYCRCTSSLIWQKVKNPATFNFKTMAHVVSFVVFNVKCVFISLSSVSKTDIFGESKNVWKILWWKIMCGFKNE